MATKHLTPTIKVKAEIAALKYKAKQILKQQNLAAREMRVDDFMKLGKEYSMVLYKLEGYRIKLSTSSSKNCYAHEYHLPSQQTI